MINICTRLLPRTSREFRDVKSHHHSRSHVEFKLWIIPQISENTSRWEANIACQGMFYTSSISFNLSQQQSGKYLTSLVTCGFQFLQTFSTSFLWYSAFLGSINSGSNVEQAVNQLHLYIQGVSTNVLTLYSQILHLNKLGMDEGNNLFHLLFT